MSGGTKNAYKNRKLGLGSQKVGSHCLRGVERKNNFLRQQHIHSKHYRYSSLTADAKTHDDNVGPQLIKPRFDIGPRFVHKY